MTDEEAIAYGKRVIDLGLNDETQAFCELAIKALETITKYKDAYNKGWNDGAKATYEHLKMCEEEQEPCEDSNANQHNFNALNALESDLISRNAALDIMHIFFTEEVYKIPTEKTENGDVLVMSKIQPFLTMNKTLSRRIKELPSVPAERTGCWINIVNKDLHDYRTGNKLCFECSECRSQYTYKSNYCPNCGCAMFEPQESEEV